MMALLALTGILPHETRGAEAAPYQPPPPLPAPASPESYPDAAGFAVRRGMLIDALAALDLGQWRRGYFTGGDPGKYLPCAALARLLVDPADAEAAKYLNDGVSRNEHYHFAAVNWARVIPLFPDVLTAATLASLSENAREYAPYIHPAGTENHKVMWWTSALILPGLLPGERFAGTSDAGALRAAKATLQSYVKGLYHAGQGEWDSSTYLAFDLNGILNIFDFCPDPEARLLAAAALDWYVAGYALKYRSGLYTAPNQRGFAASPDSTITDSIGWLWWGGGRAPDPRRLRGFLWAMHAATSSWRPDAVLTRIATKDLPGLPFEARNSKPNYWHGQSIPPMPGAYHETLFVAPHYSMGSLANGHGSQIARFQIVADAPGGGLTFFGGHPRRSDHTGKKTDLGYHDGLGRYDQSAQAGPTFVNLSRSDAGEPEQWSFFAFPDSITPPAKSGDWWVMQAGKTFVGVYPLAEKITQERVEKDPSGFPILKLHGANTGFVVETSDTTRHPDLAAFAADLSKNATVNAPGFSERMEVEVRNLNGQTLTVRHDPANTNNRADARLNGNPLTPPATPIYDSPFVHLDGGILTVRDGKSGYRIDFTGDLPEYSVP